MATAFEFTGLAKCEAAILQNMSFWANLHMFTRKVHYASKFTVLAAMSDHGLIRPFFFDQTVNSKQ